MSNRCSIIDTKGVLSGHNVSHSNRKSKRKFFPNLQNVTFISDILGRKIQMSVATSTIRTIEHNHGLDNYLLTTSNTKLSLTAKKLKKKIQEFIKPVDANAKSVDTPINDRSAEV